MLVFSAPYTNSCAVSQEGALVSYIPARLRQGSLCGSGSDDEVRTGARTGSVVRPDIIRDGQNHRNAQYFRIHSVGLSHESRLEEAGRATWRRWAVERYSYSFGEEYDGECCHKECRNPQYTAGEWGFWPACGVPTVGSSGDAALCVMMVLHSTRSGGRQGCDSLILGRYACSCLVAGRPGKYYSAKRLAAVSLHATILALWGSDRLHSTYKTREGFVCARVLSFLTNNLYDKASAGVGFWEYGDQMSRSSSANGMPVKRCALGELASIYTYMSSCPRT